MDLELAQVIADFFSAEERGDAGSLSRCFAEDAFVRDECRNIQGRAAIQERQLEAKKKYRHTIKSLASDRREAQTVVTARLTGDFAGSPVNLQFAFAVEARKIVSLEIT